MEQSSSGRLKKMGFEPTKTKIHEPESPEETDLEPREISDVSEEISETAKLRLARTPTQVEIDFPDGMECPSCKETLGLGAIICMECEINVQTGKKLKSKVKKGRNAYAAPKESTNDLADDIDWGGIGRGKYWLIAIIYTIVSQGISMAITGPDSFSDPNAMENLSSSQTITVVGIGFLSFIVSLVLQVGRLRNLGMSGWRYLQQFVFLLPIFAFIAHWTLGSVVSLIAVFIMCRYFYWILVCPPGYGNHKTLDRNGKFILVFVILLFLAIAATFGFFIFSALNEARSTALGQP